MFCQIGRVAPTINYLRDARSLLLLPGQLLRYATEMAAHRTLRRLLEALLLTALAGGITYALTAWLAPETVSPGIVAAVIMVVVCVASVAELLGLDAPPSPPKDSPWQVPENYFDLHYSLTKDISWED